MWKRLSKLLPVIVSFKFRPYWLEMSANTELFSEKVKWEGNFDIRFGIFSLVWPQKKGWPVPPFPNLTKPIL